MKKKSRRNFDGSFLAVFVRVRLFDKSVCTDLGSPSMCLHQCFTTASQHSAIGIRILSVYCVIL